MSQQACTDWSVTNTNNGTRCATCREVMICCSHEAPLDKSRPANLVWIRSTTWTSGSFQTHNTSSCTVEISTMFCVVSPCSKSGDVLKPSTAILWFAAPTMANTAVVEIQPVFSTVFRINFHTFCNELRVHVRLAGLCSGICEASHKQT